MKRRKIGRKTAKARRVKTSRRNAPKAHRTVVAEDATTAQLTRERNEALHQQAATAEILKLISSSPADTQPVFEAIVQSGLKLFPDAAIFIALPDGDKLRAAAFAERDPVRAKAWRGRWPIPLTREYMHGVAFLDRKTLEISDAREAPPELAAGAKNFLASGYRAVTVMPLMRGRTAIGTLSVVRLAPGPLSGRQVAALRSYVDQAVIAIENTRLLNELRESLQQQTATADVLKVISRSTFDLQTVLDVLTESAARLCTADIANIWLVEGSASRLAASYQTIETKQKDYLMNLPLGPSRGSCVGRTLLEAKIVHIHDIYDDPEYELETSKLEGYRTMLGVPLLREGAPIGVLALVRSVRQPFTPQQIELVNTFATQAVIAIENTRLLNELRQRTDDLTESLEQQTATSEVLKVISSSPGDLEPVFQAMLENAVRICDASFGMLFRNDGGLMNAEAMVGVPPQFAEFWRRGPQRPGPRTAFARVSEKRQTVHIADVKTEPAYVEGEPVFVAAVNLGGFRTLLNVPMLKENELIGVIAIYRQEVRPFSDKEIELLSNFAAQAVIAIENARLLNELRQRTDDLSESLEQQTATSEILEVISNSPTDTQPVFDAIVRSGLNLFPDAVVGISLPDRDLIKLAAMDGADAAGVEALRGRFPMPLSHEFITGTAILERREIDLADAREPPKELTVGAKNLLAGGYRAMTVMPMMRGDETIGALNVVRRNPGPLSDKQRGLLRTFASQAVIAIENTRLFSELSESLQQQTATADVLKVISTSPGELEPVFQAMLENAVRICEAKFGVMYRYEHNAFRAIALHGAAPASFVEARQRHPVLPVVPGTALGRLVENKEAVQIADVQAEAAYRDSPAHAIGVDMGGLRTVLSVPMLKEGVLIGAFNLFRQEVRPFAAKQVELVTNFAAQAVIAIENTRLLSELRESLQQQTATADVLTVISSSPGTLDPVFSTILAKATELCEASYSTLWLHEGDGFRTAAIHGDLPPAWIEEWRSGAIYRPGPDRPIARATEERRPIQVADMRADPSYLQGDSLPVAGVEIAGIRTLLIVPMFKESETVGVIAIYRKEVLPFTEKQIELVQNFAAQAVIAVENTRLLSELRESLQQQTATADVLKVISRSTFDLQTVLQTLVESAARLCDADRTIITRQKDGVFYRAEAHGFSQGFMDYVRNIPIAAERGSAFGRALLERRAIHIPDVKDDAEYTLLEGQQLGDYRTVLAVPMLREDVVIGVLSLTRSDVRPFTEKQIELASTFADQAAIAIENVRLFNSVEARTRELAASLEDLRTTQDRLVQTQKLASLGQLTAGIAHEIKNPLNFVNNFSAVSGELIDDLQETLRGIAFDDKARAEIDELTKTLRSNLEKVVQHGKRADGIVKNMLLHSREGSGEHRVVDVNAIVEESLNLAYHGARAEKQGFNIALERSFDAGAGTADLFPQEITRVLLNLISNGFYAASKRKAGSTDDDYVPTLRAATKSLGDSVEIRIRDNGTGIPPDVAEKIFNPFFTTKPAGEGTGLGLSLSHDIVVKQHGGSIEVETKPGEFTEFRIILPRAGAALAKVQ